MVNAGARVSFRVRVTVNARARVRVRIRAGAKARARVCVKLGLRIGQGLEIRSGFVLGLCFGL